jgi:hypothetical protein
VIPESVRKIPKDEDSLPILIKVFRGNVSGNSFVRLPENRLGFTKKFYVFFTLQRRQPHPHISPG